MDINIWVIIGSVGTVICAIIAFITLVKKNKEKSIKIEQKGNTTGSVPLTIGEISVNPSITINNNNISQNGKENPIQLSTLGLTILREVSKSNFHELFIYNNQCGIWDININGQKFNGSNIDENIIAKSAVDELINQNFIEKKNKYNYQITIKGMNYLNDNP